MKQVEGQILGQGDVLGCPEGGEPRLQAAVERVDGAMCKIRDAGKIKARDRIAVLAALNLAFDLTEKAPTAAEASMDGQQLQDLLNRLDVALGVDGQLL